MGVIRFTVGGTAKLTGMVAKGTATGMGKLISKKYPETGKFLTETGYAIVDSSVSAIDNVSQFADGSLQAGYGAVKKDEQVRQAGFSNMKEPVGRTVRGIGKAAKYGASNASLAVGGLASGNKEQVKDSGRNLLKMAIVMTTAVGVADAFIDAEPAEAEGFDARNGDLGGDIHPETGVPFEKNQIYYNGEVYTDSFPVFSAAFEAELPERMYEMNDAVHIHEANMQLFGAIQEDPTLADGIGLTPEEVGALRTGSTPEGYDWHHHEEPGRIQLVEEDVHQQTGHSGGREIWGGGTEAR